jgi:hypothetical protein
MSRIEPNFLSFCALYVNVQGVGYAGPGKA